MASQDKKKKKKGKKKDLFCRGPDYTSGILDGTFNKNYHEYSNQCIPTNFLAESVNGVKEQGNSSEEVVSKTYQEEIKEIQEETKNFNFIIARSGRSREIISLYFFELLLNTETDLSKLILRLREIDISDIVLRLREIIINGNKELLRRITLKEHNLLKQLEKREIETLQDLANNYPDTFTNYFSDLVEVIKCLIISNRSHKIIDADFSLSHFIRFLWCKGYNLFLTERSLFKVIRRIFDFLKDTRYSDLFPNRFGSRGGESKHEHERVSGSRIKLFVMKYIYDGRYFDERDGIAKCPECVREGFVVNTSSPRLRSIEFHHEGIKLMRYTADKFYTLFTERRGNPYFLQYLIKKMEDENVVLLCGSHHRKHQCDYLVLFKKLVSWENIPREFSQDIFELPAEIIHILVILCIENFHLTKIKSQAQKEEIRQELIYRLKERYIIDIIYEGICPVCGEFNTREHLFAFEFNHLYELRKLSPEKRKEFKNIKKRPRQILERFPCSEAVRELEVQEGGFICRNCHAFIHEDMTIVDKIYDDQDVLRSVYEDNRKSIDRYNENLISGIELVEDPLKSGVMKFKAFTDYLFRFFKIMEEKGEITTGDLASDKKCDRRTVNKFFREREDDLEKYGTIKFGDNRNQTRFYMNEEGKNIVRLLKYFEQYYQNLQ